MSIAPHLRNHIATIAPPQSAAVAISPSHDRLARFHLTAREREALHWIAEGKRDREIACIMGVSLRTAEHHVSKVLEKLSVETRTAAARVGLDRSLEPGPHNGRMLPKTASANSAKNGTDL